MRQIILALCITCVSLPALAIQRYNVLEMSCSAVQNAVNRDGAAILRYHSTRDPSLPLYDRYVRNRLFCEPYQFAARARVPTKDNNQCVVHKCSNRPFGVPIDN